MLKRRRAGCSQGVTSLRMKFERIDAVGYDSNTIDRDTFGRSKSLATFSETAKNGLWDAHTEERSPIELIVCDD